MRFHNFDLNNAHIRLLPILMCAFLLLLWTGPGVMAAGPDENEEQTAQLGQERLPDENQGATLITADDGGKWEVGIHGSAGNLTQATAAERYGMWYWLNGWFNRNYSFGESTAWEEDFKLHSLGGKNNYYIDSVDLQFYVGHGAPGRFTFDNSSHDDSTLLAPNDCLDAWGDGDNEWLALTSCQVLSGSGLGKMAQCMNGQHLILGFVTNASAHNAFYNTQAYWFGRYMRLGYNMTQSWFKGCDVAQRGRTARVLGEAPACFNDNPYNGTVCADTDASSYWWYTHSCGTETARLVPAADVREMPVFKIDPYSLDDANRDLNRLGGIFSVPVTRTVRISSPSEDGTPPPGPDDTLNPMLVAGGDGQFLEKDKDSSIYQYSDLNQLWNEQQIYQAMAVNSAAANSINADDARLVADTFLNRNNLMPQDAVFYEVISDTVGSLSRSSLASADMVAAAEMPTVWQVIYSRVITASVLQAAGVNADLQFSVVGPGAKQKVYVPISAPVGAASILDTVPVGAQGGWRGFSPQVTAAGVQVMDPIIDATTAISLYLALDKDVTMNSIPLDFKSQDVLSYTLAYWEEGPGASQGVLTPVYELFVRFVERSTDEVSDDYVYLPAATKYMAPIARIMDAPASVLGGSELTLTAADATQTLRDLGVADIDLVLGTGGLYTYEWYLGSVAEENRITDKVTTDGLTKVTFDAPNTSGSQRDYLDVLLVVTDTESDNLASSSATAQLRIPVIYLPTVIR